MFGALKQMQEVNNSKNKIAFRSQPSRIEVRGMNDLLGQTDRVRKFQPKVASPSKDIKEFITQIELK